MSLASGDSRFSSSRNSAVRPSEAAIRDIFSAEGRGGLLNKQLDDFNRPYFSLQIEGSKTGLELPGIVDEVITLAELPRENETPTRGFVCTTLNAFGYPAKDRSGRLGMVEEPHLGRLMDKIRSPQATPPTERLQFTPLLAGPATPAAIPDTTATTTEG
jgi:hypothetical protein